MNKDLLRMIACLLYILKTSKKSNIGYTVGKLSRCKSIMKFGHSEAIAMKLRCIVYAPWLKLQCGRYPIVLCGYSMETRYLTLRT